MENEESFIETYKNIGIDVNNLEDIDKLINTCIGIVSRNVRGRTDDETLENISRMKIAHAILTNIYNRRPSVIYRMYVGKWGEGVTASYDKLYNIDSTPVEKTLLSLMIAERALLAKKGMLKHASIAIVGLGGSGKTTYAVSSIVGASRILNISNIDKFIFFEPIDFIDFVKERLETKTWVPAVILDDVGAQISKYWVWLGQKWWAHLFSLLDHVKDWCGVLIITSGSFSIIPSGLRDKIDLVIEANEVTYGRYIMNVFTWYRRDKYNMKTKNIPVYIDVMPPTMLMPKKMWMEMIEARRTIGIHRIDEIKKRIEEMKKEENELEEDSYEQDR